MENFEFRLGADGALVSPIGLGCWQFSGGDGFAGSYWRGLSQDEVNDIVRRSLELGITWFDTAELYGNGASERALSVALQAAGAPHDTTVATKWRPFFRTARSIRSTYPDRERFLAPYPIALHQVHAPVSLASYGNEMRQMASLVREGRLGQIGVSNFNAKQMTAAHRALEAEGQRLATNQMRYSLLDRRIEDNGVLDAARELGITIIAYSPLEQGILTGRFHRDPEARNRLTGPRRLMPAFAERGIERVRPLMEVLEAIASDLEATPAQVSLAWLIQANAPHVLVIPGASSVSQVESNARAMHLQLTETHRGRIDEASRAVAR